MSINEEQVGLLKLAITQMSSFLCSIPTEGLCRAMSEQDVQQSYARIKKVYEDWDHFMDTVAPKSDHVEKRLCEIVENLKVIGSTSRGVIDKVNSLDFKNLREFMDICTLFERHMNSGLLKSVINLTEVKHNGS